MSVEKDDQLQQGSVNGPAENIKTLLTLTPFPVDEQIPTSQSQQSKSKKHAHNTSSGNRTGGTKSGQLNTHQSSNSQHQPIKEIRVLTYNIFLRPPPIKNNKDDYKNERTKLFLNSIEHFDVICFQELFGFLNQRKHKIIFNGMKQGFYYHASSPSPSFYSSYLVDGGVVTISRYPIVEKVFKPYKYGVFSDNLSQKGVLYTKIAINDAFVHVFNTHLQASYVGAEHNVKATVITRIDQLKLMNKFIEEQVAKSRATPEDLVLICGDFNVNARDFKYPIHFLDSAPEVKSEMLKTNDTEFSEYDVLKCILSRFGKHTFIDSLRTKFNGESPVTYADTQIDSETMEEVPREEALTIREDLKLKMCLDYIIELKLSDLPASSEDSTEGHIRISIENTTQNDQTIETRRENGFDNQILDPSSANSSRKQNTLSKGNQFVLDIEQVSVEEFFVKNQPFTQLSDHYGVSAVLQYHQPSMSQKKPIRVNNDREKPISKSSIIGKNSNNNKNEDQDSYSN